MLQRVNRMTIRVLQRIVIVSSFILSTQEICGQSRDFQTREIFELSTDLTKKMEGSLEFAQRLKKNSLRFDRSLLTAAMEYDLPKGFSVGAGARYILVMDSEQTLESKYRLNADVNYKPKISSFQFKFRNRIQHGYDDISFTSGNKLTNRCRAGIAYDIFGVPLSVYTSFEVYLVLNDPTNPANTLNKYIAGIKWDLPKKWDLNLYYLCENEVNISNPLQAHIVVAALGLKL